MSQKANPTLIGVFVFGAILIAIGAAVFFGSADFFSKKQTYVSYFNQSVSGLQVGSNVKFKGVAIGKVTKVLLGFVGEDKPVYAKVFYQVDENFVVKELGTNSGGVNVDLSDPQQHMKRVEQGLRARLDFESLISGQLYVALDCILSGRDGINALNLAERGKSLDNLVNGPDLKRELTSGKTTFDQLDATLKKL